MAPRTGPDGLPPGSAPIVIEIADIATAPGGVVDRADALLNLLHRLDPHDSFIALYHPGHHEDLYLVRSLYGDRGYEYLDGADFLDGLGPERPRGPLNSGGPPVPGQGLQRSIRYVTPAGLREGVGVGLFSVDGRYLGFVGLSTGNAAPSTAAVGALIVTLAPLVAYAVDPMRSIAAVAASVADATAGVVVTDAGSALPLPGLPTHPSLAGGSALLQAVAEQLAGGGVQATFLAPVPAATGQGAIVRVTALAAPLDPPHDQATVVVVSPHGDLRGLTGRELEVLGLLVGGWPNQAIALELGITERTAAAHLEHITAKLTATSRTIAAVSALRLGLFVPRLLHSAVLAGRDAPR
jgi:DNA-binding CsgD family transcriptional regulator